MAGFRKEERFFTRGQASPSLKDIQSHFKCRNTRGNKKKNIRFERSHAGIKRSMWGGKTGASAV